MKTELRILSISLLLALSAAHVHAQPERHDWRNDLKAMNQQARDPQQARQAQPSDRVTGSEGHSNAPTNEASDQSRKSGRMTAEERRALRRQINEAGRDIYTSSH